MKIETKVILKKMWKKHLFKLYTIDHLNEKDLSDLPALSEKEKQAIDEVWGKYVMNNEYKYWQYYYKKTGKFDVNFVPDNIWFFYICKHFNDANFSKQMDDKALYDILLPNLKMPEIIIRVVNNRILDKDFNTISPKDIRGIVDKINGVILKPAKDSSGGKGIKIYSRDQYERIEFDIVQYRDAVIQPLVKQSECINRLNPSCINTIRISSLILKNGEVIIPAAMIRLGVNGENVDNASAGGIFVGIDICTGRLKEYAQASKGSFSKEKYYKHPNTGVEFKNYKIDGFDKIKQTIFNKAKYLPRTRLIGWDFCIDENNNPIIIEVNLENHGCEGMQIACGAYFGEYTKRVLDEIDWSIG